MDGSAEQQEAPDSQFKEASSLLWASVRVEFVHVKRVCDVVW